MKDGVGDGRATGDDDGDDDDDERPMMIGVISAGQRGRGFVTSPVARVVDHTASSVCVCLSFWV